ncbi:MAG: serine acetyltransferase [Planctomycetes bacterium]|nr:serine acetyltransferase [Planctomycetota bacterium]
MPENVQIAVATQIRSRKAFLSRIAVWNSRQNGSRFWPIRFLRRCIWIILGSDIGIRLSQTTALPHPYGIFVNGGATIGENCTIMQQVTIGSDHFKPGVAATIGNSVYLGAGAKIIGGLKIGDGAIVGANTVVTRDVPAGTVVVGANRIINR